MTRFLLAGVAGLIVLGAEPALAQVSLNNAIAGPMTGANGRVTRDREPARPTPAGVPGSRAEPVAVAPAEKTPSDMPPTEALFDAINRGDIAVAKDAINRGADIHGTNVLGLTPLELSVDLGRNNITFLLLSLRGGSGYSVSNGPRAAKPPTAAELRAQARAEQAERRSSRASAARRGPVAPVAPRTARLFAGDGGAPVPQAGFLGFDSAR